MNSNLVPSSRIGKPDSRDFCFISLIIGQRNLPYLVAARSCGLLLRSEKLREFRFTCSPSNDSIERPFLSASTPVLATPLSG